ncbi:MAG: hypothetical protein QF645_12045, partial [Planctomycetota bacterium]|nr:hypothetical protein [Planctomycetota bacterium]
MQFHIRFHYFNPFLSKWEPCIEPVAIQIEYMTSEYNDQKQVFLLKLNKNTPNLNLNISYEFLHVFEKTR